MLIDANEGNRLRGLVHVHVEDTAARVGEARPLLDERLGPFGDFAGEAIERPFTDAVPILRYAIHCSPEELTNAA